VIGCSVTPANHHAHRLISETASSSRLDKVMVDHLAGQSLKSPR
jgi:hypothetical protein